MCSISSRAELALMCLDEYAFGWHVTDRAAFRLRLLSLQHRRDVLWLVAD